MDFLFQLFQPPWVYCLSIAYAPAVLRSFFFFIHDGWFGVRHLNRLAGRFELYLGWMRDTFFVVVALAVAGHRIYWAVEFGLPFGLPVEIAFLLAALYSRWWRWHGLKELQEFARLNPRVHPAEFFQHLYGRLGFLPHRVPLAAARFVDPAHLDFKTGRRARRSFWALLHGLYDTYLFVTLAYKAFKWQGAHYIRTAGSGLSIVWASRVAQIARMEVVVEKSPQMALVRQGKRIYAINHKSVFDFCLAPLAYFRENSDGSAASFMPSIMVAKDHFRDNPFLYRVIGLGKMLEAWGMVFVDRKSKKEGVARRASGLAVKKILSSDMSFSIYPQGTRAWGQLARDGSRWDAGYFCVGRDGRLARDRGHFKKGVAYVALETALSLMKQKLAGAVWVIPVGMTGIGTACPKGSWKVQTQTKVVIRVGEPINVQTLELEKFRDATYRDISEQAEYKEKIGEICGKVDRSLQQLLEVVPRLERRFFIDLGNLLESRSGVDEVAVAFKEWRSEGELVYVILDYIYCLPMKYWNGYLVELANLLRGTCSRDDLVGLRNKIAACF